MKRFLLPLVAVVLTSACTMLEQANDLLFSKKAVAPEEKQIIVKQVIVQPVMLRNVNVARQMQTDIPVTNKFLSPYTYPYRKVVYPTDLRRNK